MKYLRRGVWYLASRLFLICLIFGITITVFYYAMNLSNIQVIVKDGMAARAKVVMGIETESDTLNRYFQPACIRADERLNSALNGVSDYSDYNVRGIDHRISTGFLWTWPWDTTVRLKIQESIPRIDGRVKGTKADEVIARDGSKAIYPPEWKDTQYEVALVKENGQWKIRSLAASYGD